MAERKHRVDYEVTARDGTRAAFDSVKRNFAGVEAAGNRMQGMLGGVAAAIAGLGIHQMVSAALEAERAGNRVTAVLRAQGEAATFAKREIDEMAEELFELTQFDDESIRNAAAELLKFGNIHGDVFRRALKLSADYAAFTGSDMADAAQTVGKALQSPVEGMGMMERQIGRLTPEQDKLIKRLVEQKRGMEAQIAVLDIVQGKIGGTAEIMNTGLSKGIGDVKKQWGELMETLGASGTHFDKALSGAASLLRDIRLTIEGTRNPLRELLVDMGKWLQNYPILGDLTARALASGGQKSGKIKGIDGRPVGESVAPAPTSVTLGGDDRAAKEAERLLDKFRDKLRGLEQEARKVFGIDSASEEMEALLRTDKDLQKLSAARKQALRDAAARIDAEKSLALVLKQNAEAEEQQARDVSDAWSAVPAMMEKLRGREYFENIYGADAIGGMPLDDVKQFHRSMLEGIDAATDVAERATRVYAGFNEEGTEAITKAKSQWEDLGITMMSSLDGVIERGAKARDIVVALGMDLAKILYRKYALEPAGKFIGGVLDNLFSGFKLGSGSSSSGGGSYMGPSAEGGPRWAGQPLLVGEHGPEVFIPGAHGYMVPNHQLRGGGGGGLTVNQTIRVGGEVTAADLERTREAAKRGAIEGVAELASRSPAFRRQLVGA